ncbi:DNA (cytosine-5)-methyltransferase 1 [Actinoalloteichus hoggarensis]|uniref:Cytosine-specific methyltransferase n=2 Tax=Actinoalloteichus hoggarensis TaxID=1470176 RepID=A0A221W3P3_9PSEU|nr:Modification methylase HaeIII [Actinoalloteichus hoggarensis]MBB5919017.1 DNA (cytosine-5)-methyltransferase 1 [Actinoalloteichus hoggarensis]
MPTMIDLFAGCGGMTGGFVAAGFDTALAVEVNPYAAATYAANFGEDHVRPVDIATVPASEVPPVDVVVGGPPCQGFSSLGSRDLADPRNQLWREYVRVVRAAHPKVFVIENVDRFLSSPEFGLLRAEVDGGSLAGYTLTYGHLNAADYGVAQRRRRTIIIGSRIGPVALPSPTHGRGEAGGLPASLLPWADTRSRIAELPERPHTTELPKTTATYFGRTFPGVFSGLDLHLGRRPTELSLRRYDSVPPGGGRFDVPRELLPRCWRDKPTGTTDVMGRMRWDAPSLTIRTEFFKPEKGQYLHPQWDADSPDRRVNRPITHYEAALLQDFPADFRWCGTKAEIARQIGNAVPLGLARALAGQVATALA